MAVVVVVDTMMTIEEEEDDNYQCQAIPHWDVLGLEGEEREVEWLVIAAASVVDRMRNWQIL